MTAVPSRISRGPFAVVHNKFTWGCLAFLSCILSKCYYSVKIVRTTQAIYTLLSLKVSVPYRPLKFHPRKLSTFSRLRQTQSSAWKWHDVQYTRKAELGLIWRELNSLFFETKLSLFSPSNQPNPEQYRFKRARRNFQSQFPFPNRIETFNFSMYSAVHVQPTVQLHQYYHGVLCCTNVDLSAHFEPNLSLLESFSAES